jgi:hypothetical protein
MPSATSLAAAPPPAANPPWYRQRWPWLLMAGPGIVVVASFYSGWLALSTDDGVVTDDYYKRGLSINRKLERVDRAMALHLGAAVDMSPDGGVRVVLVSPSPDPDAVPAAMRLKFTHPTRAGFDRSAELVRGPDGAYTGRIGSIAPGRWLVSLETDAWRMPAVELAGDMTSFRLGAITAPGS